MDSELLQQAVAHIRAGRPADARRLLAKLLDGDPHNEAAWFWLVETMPTRDQRIEVLHQCLRFNPQSRQARLGLEKLTSQQTPPATTSAPAPTASGCLTARPTCPRGRRHPFEDENHPRTAAYATASRAGPEALPARRRSVCHVRANPRASPTRRARRRPFRKSQIPS